MKKTILSLSCLIIGLTAIGQEVEPTRSSEWCHTSHVMNEMRQNPELNKSLEKDAAVLEGLRESVRNHTNVSKKMAVRTIPIVFHVLHNGGPENISDEQVFEQVELLNKDYRLLNASAAGVQPAFAGMPTDVEIEFKLAQYAPDGTCFNGITRTESAASFNGSFGGTQVNAIKNGNDVYQGNWTSDKYLNIFVCGELTAPGVLGYTQLPSSSTSMNKGIWIIHSAVGSIGTSQPYVSTSLTHEIGHWLGLEHTWGGTNQPEVASNCNDDDGIQDTPNCIGTQNICNHALNTCDSDNAYWGYDIQDNIQNYMDYSFCSIMFTPDQAAVMNSVLDYAPWPYDNLVSSSNAALVGTNGLILCKADFSTERSTICAGEAVQFNDISYNTANGWTWTFVGGVPAGSSSQNPSVVYNTPGLYEVILEATDGSATDTETKTDYIRVLPAGGGVPFNEGFEAYTTLTDQVEWEVYNPDGNAEWDITTAASHSGARSAKLANFGQDAGSIDELSSSPVDLSSITSATAMTLTFRYAYRKRSAGNDEYLRVLVTNDCGDTWVTRKTMHGDILSDQVSSTSWTPADFNDWETVHMTNVTSSYWVDNFRYKFKFDSDGGNNLYLDNINLYPGAPQYDVVVGLAEGKELDDLKVYPNPTEEELNIKFSVGAAQQVNFVIQDVTGKTVQTNLINANAGSNYVMMDVNSLASGMYFLNILTGGTQQTVQFVVK